VVVPYFELPEFLPEAIRSVLQQTYRPIEIIVVDDGSLLNPAVPLLREAKLLVDSVISLPENRGIGAARNAGIRMASGNFIVTLDGDDRIEPTYIEETLSAVNSSGAAAAYTQVRHFGDENGIFSHEITLKSLLAREGAVSSLLFKRELFDAVGGYTENRQLSEDYQFLIDAVDAGWKFCRVDKPLYCYRKHAHGASLKDIDKRMPAQIEQNRLLYQQHASAVIEKQEAKFLKIHSEYQKILSAYNSVLAEWQQFRVERQHLMSELDQSKVAHNFLETELKSWQLRTRKIELDRQRLLTSLYFNNYRAKTITQITSRLLGSNSWRLTDPIRKTKLSLRNLASISRNFFAAESYCESSELIMGSGLFDWFYYMEQCDSLPHLPRNPIQHFVQEGWKLGFNPNPFFNTRFYLEKLEQIKRSTTHDPLTHYLLEGASAGLATCEFFDTAWYTHEYPDVSLSGMNALAHFLSFGLLEGRIPIDILPFEENHNLLPMTEAVPLSAAAAGAPINAQSAADRFADQASESFNSAPYDLIIAVHQASRTGAPMLGLAITRVLSQRGFKILSVVMESGELVADFSKLSDVVVLSSAPKSPDELLAGKLDELRETGLLLPATTVLMNSAGLHGLHEVFKDKGFRVISLIHEFLSSYPLFARASVLQHSDLAVYSSHITLADANQACLVKCESKVIPQGIIDPEFGVLSKHAGKEYLLQHYGIPTDAFVVLACGTLEQRKGVDIFTQVAIQILQSSSPRSDLYFIWVGANNDGDLQPTIWAKTDLEQSGIERNVFFVGAKRDLSHYFAGADLFMLPSRRDPLPCVLHLAMAAALPVLAFGNSGGAAEVLVDGGGKILPYGNVGAMCQGLLEYYNDRNSCTTDGAIGRELIKSKYQLDDYVDSLLEIAELTKSDAESAVCFNKPEPALGSA
jgi:glycosyltransferase involved in cell wall biosynthesis